MFISLELIDAIKKGFGFDDFTYIGIGKSVGGRPILLFDTGTLNIAIREKSFGYEIFRVVESAIFDGRYARLDVFNTFMYIDDKLNETVLLGEGIGTHRFQGKAFDFSVEKVIMALEE